MGLLVARSPAAEEPLEAVLDRYLVSGDETAMEQVVARTRPRLLGAARNIGRPQDAEDSVQAAYLSLVRKRGEPLEAPVVPWLLTAVIRIAYRRKAIERREQGIAHLLSVPRGLPAPDAEAMSAEESARLWREVARLPEKYRDPVVLHHLHGLPTPEVARLLDLPEATVRTRLHRGRGLLRMRLPAGLALGLMAAVWFLVDAGKAGGGFAAAAVGGVMTTGGALGVGVAGVVLGAVIGAKLLGGGDPGAEERIRTSQAQVDQAKKERDEVVDRVQRVQKALDEANRKVVEQEKALATVKENNDLLQAKMDKWESRPIKSLDELSKEPKEAPAPLLRFSFGEYDAALGEVDWKSVGESTNSMVPLITELRDSIKKGGPFPLETAGKIQRLNGSLIQAAAKIADKIPGSGINGSYTHPAFMVNAMAATLEAAGLPLTESQAESLGKLGRDFTERDRARSAGYDERTLDLLKVLEEAEMKDQFFGQALGLLTEKQRETLSPEATRGILGLDLFSSGLMLAGHIMPMMAKDLDGYLGQVERAFVDRLGFPADRREELKAVLKSWGADLPAAWFTEPTETMMGVQPVLRVEALEEMARRQLPLLRKVVEDMSLTEEQAASIRGAGVIAVPVISK